MCSSTCSTWNSLICSFKRLSERKNCLDAYEPIQVRLNFNCMYSIHRGVCTLGNRIIVSNAGNNVIEIYDNHGQPVDQFGSTGNGSGQFCYPSDVCTHGQLLLITDCDNKRIQIYNSDFKFVSSISTLKFCPTGICITRNGKIIVITLDDIVLIFGENGQLVKQFSFETVGYYQTNMWPGICCNSKDEILIANPLKHQIAIFNQSGQLLKSFGSKGTNPDQFECPTGVCVDVEDNIFVADQKNNRVSIFTSDGLPIQQVNFMYVSKLFLVGSRLIVTTSSKGHLIGVFSN